jgi:hypothetical protein
LEPQADLAAQPVEPLVTQADPASPDAREEES